VHSPTSSPLDAFAIALIVRYSVSRLSVFTFLVRLFGVAAGHLVFHEPLTPAFIFAGLSLPAASSSSTGRGSAICLEVTAPRLCGPRGICI